LNKLCLTDDDQVTDDIDFRLTKRYNMFINNRLILQSSYTSHRLSDISRLFVHGC